MKLEDYFETFLKSEVNLNKYRLDSLEDRTQAIVRALEKDQVVGSHITDWQKQGSWAQRTIVKPQKSDEFDADILLFLEEAKGWQPQDYIGHINGALKRSTKYSTKVQRKTRCVRVVYANDCHVDVVPAIRRASGLVLIANLETNSFERTEPEVFTSWLTEKDAIAGGNLRKCIRLLKYLRDSKDAFTMPSVVLTLLLGEQVQSDGAKERYSDLPTSFVSLLTDLTLYLNSSPKTVMPTVKLPGSEGVSLNHRLGDSSQIAHFKKRISSYAKLASEAKNDVDPIKAERKWRELFGDKFAPKDKLEHTPKNRSFSYNPETTHHASEVAGEMFIEDTYPMDVKYYGAITARVFPKIGFRDGLLSKLKSVEKDRNLLFTFESNIIGEYELWWKVRNFGPAARGQYRGEIKKGYPHSNTHSEPTVFAGDHWIEAYAVQNGRVVAWAHCPVKIK